MVTTMQARNIVGIIGNVISFILFVSPIPTFYKIVKNKSVEEFKPDPYLATILNCLLWMFYGLPLVHPNSTLVITINGVGLVIETVYITIYFMYTDKKGRLKVISWICIELVFVGIVAACTLLLFHTHTKRSAVVGILCVIFGVIMYSSPLTVMAKVIKTKSVKYMPFGLSLANFFNGIVWTAYSLIIFDIYILIGNGLGTLSGVVQLVLYASYYKSTPKDDSKPSELQLV